MIPLSRILIACALGLVGVAAIVTCLEACSSSCTLIGCVDSVSVQVQLPGRLDKITRAEGDSGQRGHIQVCREKACTDIYPAGCVPLEPDGAPYVQCDQDMTDTLTLTYHVPFNAPPVDGELFVVRVFDASGALLAERSGHASYSSVYPNGRSCGAECTQAICPRCRSADCTSTV